MVQLTTSMYPAGHYNLLAATLNVQLGSAIVQLSSAIVQLATAILHRIMWQPATKSVAAVADIRRLVIFDRYSK